MKNISAAISSALVHTYTIGVKFPAQGNYNSSTWGITLHSANISHRTTRIIVECCYLRPTGQLLLQLLLSTTCRIPLSFYRKLASCKLFTLHVVYKFRHDMSRGSNWHQIYYHGSMTSLLLKASWGGGIIIESCIEQNSPCVRIRISIYIQTIHCSPQLNCTYTCIHRPVPCKLLVNFQLHLALIPYYSTVNSRFLCKIKNMHIDRCTWLWHDGPEKEETVAKPLYPLVSSNLIFK